MGELTPNISDKIERIEKKFRSSGQDLGSYLDGLLYTRGFQFVQFWMIGISSTPLEHQVHSDLVKEVKIDTIIKELFQNINWKRGAISQQTRYKTSLYSNFKTGIQKNF